MNIQPMHSLRHRGAGLIEVLVVILILGVGMLSMAKIHALILRDGGSANNRAIAMALAQDKIDEFRGFKCPKNNTTGCTLNVGESDFDSIASGSDASAITSLTAAGVTTSLTQSYARSWTVTNWTLCRDTADADGDGNTTESLPFSSNCGKPYPDYKTVTVTVAWTDSNGAQTVNLTTSIQANDAYSAAMASGGAGTQYPGPRVGYTPIGAPDSVPIDIGGGRTTETSKPLPEVEGSGSLTVTFPAVVYGNNYGTGIGYALESQEEFKTVNCTCTLQSAGHGYSPFRTIWDPNKKTTVLYPAWQAGVAINSGARRSNANKNYQAATSGTTGNTAPTHSSGSASDGGVDWQYLGPVAPVVGALVTESGAWLSKESGAPAGNGQSPLCSECCRDHHDAGTGYPTYRPYATSAEFDGSSNHKHYKVGTTPGANGSLAGNGDNYVEACRMKRINGIWRVVPDWNLIGLTTFPCDYFATTPTVTCPPDANTNPTSSAQLSAYRTQVQNLLRQFADYVGDNNTSTALPLFTANAGTNASPPVSSLLDISNDAHDVDPTRQLIARAIYADVIFEPRTTGNNPRRVDANWAIKITPIAGGGSGLDNLQYLPFYDANVTLLANWKPTSTVTAGNADYGDCSPASLASGDWSHTPLPNAAVCVTNQAIDTIDETTNDYYDDSYSRGHLSAKASSGETLITAYLDRGNNGLTSSASITSVSGYELTSQVNAKIPGAGTISLKFMLTFYSTNNSCKVASNTKDTVHTGIAASWSDGTASGTCVTGHQGNDYWYTCTGIPAAAAGVDVSFNAPAGYSIKENNVGVTWHDPYVHTLTSLGALPDPVTTVIVRTGAPAATCN